MSHDDSNQMVGFPPSFATDNYFPFCGIVKPSLKTTGSYSTVLLLARSPATLVNSVIKTGAGGCCRHVAALLCNILDYVEHGLSIIPEDKTCTDTPQQWNRPRYIPGEISQVKYPR